MVRRACVEKRQSSRAAKHSLNEMWLSVSAQWWQQWNLISRLTAVFAKPHQRSHIPEHCSSPKLYPSWSRTHLQKWLWELAHWKVEVGKALGQMKTESVSLVANGLLIEEATHPAFLHENLLHPHGRSEARLDHSTQEAVVLSTQSCCSRSNNISLPCFEAFLHNKSCIGHSTIAVSSVCSFKTSKGTLLPYSWHKWRKI